MDSTVLSMVRWSHIHLLTCIPDFVHIKYKIQHSFSLHFRLSVKCFSPPCKLVQDHWCHSSQSQCSSVGVKMFEGYSTLRKWILKKKNRSSKSVSTLIACVYISHQYMFILLFYVGLLFFPLNCEYNETCCRKKECRLWYWQ